MEIVRGLFYVWSLGKASPRKMIFEQRLQGCEGVIHMDISRKSVPGGGKSKYKCSEGEVYLDVGYILQVTAEEFASGLDVE